jgi:hypothetical protein
MSNQVIYIGVDPGPEEHGVVWYDAESRRVVEARNIKTIDLQTELHGQPRVAIEWIECYGMAVGKSVFETVAEIGRLIDFPAELRLIPRRSVKMHLCQSMKAKDPNIRQALIDKLGPQGTKKNPGPTFGIGGHLWAALAVAVTSAETMATEAEYRPKMRQQID